MDVSKDEIGAILRARFLAVAEHFSRYSGGENWTDMGAAMHAMQTFNADQKAAADRIRSLPVAQWIPVLAAEQPQPLGREAGQTVGPSVRRTLRSLTAAPQPLPENTSTE